MEVAEWKPEADGFVCHSAAFGVYLKAAGNQKEVLSGLLLHVQIVEGSLECFRENELEGDRDKELIQRRCHSCSKKRAKEVTVGMGKWLNFRDIEEVESVGSGTREGRS